MKKMIVTGALGLIGSEVSEFFLKQNWNVIGIDNNQRKVFFGEGGDTSNSIIRLSKYPNFRIIDNIDIRNREAILKLIPDLKPDAVIHTAAQPSHDRAASIPFEDFDTNAVGTFNLIESLRRFSLNIPFVHLSTNKVYGDGPNNIELIEKSTRFDISDINYLNGIPETFNIDHTTHSLFGASKVSADIIVQEYGRYFGMPTVCLRGGCLTGPNHAGVELHGFLSYLIKCNLESKEYTIFGYKGKQVRDNIHSFDVANFIKLFLENPKKGAVYNIGGGKANTISILEAFQKIQNLSQKEMQYTYSDKNRIGDHICYYSDLSNISKDYPSWSISRTIDDVFQEIYEKYRAANK